MKLDDAELAERLPAGEAATFAEHVKACHGVWRVMLWMTAILN